ncbi:MAG: Mur ligase family protein [Chloroflexota bacterium]
MPRNAHSVPEDDPRYVAALHRLLGLADYERMIGTADPAPKNDLARMAALTARMGEPQRFAPVLHVAGSKGKGSVAAMAASILAAAGLRVGLYTSPHLHSFTERIRLDGEPLAPGAFAYAVERAWPHVEALASTEHGRPTTFEVLTAMAFDVFRQEQVDVQVVEVGLGGRLDATNVAEARVAAITLIGMEHQAILGDTLAAIAGEKAGIIKRGCAVVSAPQAPEAARVIGARAAALGCDLTRVGEHVRASFGEHDLTGQSAQVTTPTATYYARLPLLGAYQAENAAVAVAAVERMGLGVSPEAIEAGLAAVRWDGRFQVLSQRPAVIVDGAHTPFSLDLLAANLADYLPGVPVSIVFGCSGDKDLPAMTAALAGVVSRVIACASHHPRAVPADRVAAAFRERGVAAETAGEVGAALQRAVSLAGEGGAVLATGSLFIAAEALEAWFGIPGERYPEFDPQAAALHRGGA